MPITLNGSGLASGVTSVPNLATFPAGPGLAAINMPTGSVVQVVQATYPGTAATMSITSSSTQVASAFTASITPQFSSSKILAQVWTSLGSTSSNSGVALTAQIYRSINSGAYTAVGNQYNNYLNTITTYLAYFQTPCIMSYLDSPSTTNPVTYQPYFNGSCGTSGGNAVLGGRNTDGLQYAGCTVLLMEIR